MSVFPKKIVWITTWCSEKISSILYHTKPPKHFKFPQNNELWDKLYMNSAIWYRITFFFLWLWQKYFLGMFGVFLCKPWQCFWVNLKTSSSILFSSNTCYSVQPPFESSKQMSKLLYFFLSFKMCNSTFIENFMFKFSFSMSQCSHS